MGYEEAAEEQAEKNKVNDEAPAKDIDEFQNLDIDEARKKLDEMRAKAKQKKDKEEKDKVEAENKELDDVDKMSTTELQEKNKKYLRGVLAKLMASTQKQ